METVADLIIYYRGFSLINIYLFFWFYSGTVMHMSAYDCYAPLNYYVHLNTASI